MELNKEAPDIGTIPPNICDVTELTILKRPEWTDVRCSENFKLTISIIGDNIIYTQGSGYGGLLDIQASVELADKVAAENLPEGYGYVRIEDFSNFEGTSLEARKHYIDNMKNKERLAGLIFCGASPMMKMSIKLGKRLNIVKFDVQIVNDYSEAVKLALKILSTGKSQPDEPIVQERFQPPVFSPKEDLSPKIITNDVLHFQLDGFSARFEVIDDYIFHANGSGFLEEGHVVPLFRGYEKVLSSQSLPKGIYYFVAGVKNANASRKARRLYLEHIIRWHKDHPFRMYIFYGANRLLSAAINMSRHFVPFPVRMVKDLYSALKLINEEKAKNRKSEPLPTAGGALKRPVTSGQDQQMIEELLQYLGSINWEVDGFDFRRGIDPSHPLSPVFDAIELIKGDLDNLFWERKEAEDALRESEEKLARAKKMEALGLLAGGVSHDLNNVLSGIVSYPELLLLDLPKDSKLRKPIETIQETGHRAAAIVRDLLTVARGVAITKEPLNLNAIVEDYLLSPEFEKLKRFHPTVTIETNLDTDLFNISGSDAHLRKVVMNLVSNASEAIEGSGNVIISTMNRYIDRAIRDYDEVHVGEYAVLSVSDGGPGISPDDLERIFEPFYTKKVMGRSGTGLGLAVVWNVVQDLKGYLNVISDENGTTFELYFPITRDEVSDKALPIPIKDYKGDGETVLIVDDVESQREIVCEMLSTLGYKAKAVSSGEEAVEYLKEHTVDLILLDMIMDPGINGRETYERIIKIHPNQKAVIASGYAETDDVKETQRLGAGPYIKKPLTLEQIGIAVRDELKK